MTNEEARRQIKTNIEDLLRRAKEYGITARDIAAHGNLEYRYISLWKWGKSVPSADNYLSFQNACQELISQNKRKKKPKS